MLEGFVSQRSRPIHHSTCRLRLSARPHLDLYIDIAAQKPSDVVKRRKGVMASTWSQIRSGVGESHFSRIASSPGAVLIKDGTIP